MSLILRPTPLHRLDAISDQLGLDLWIKRDDLTGFALGGNKGRKLEFLIAQAIEIGAEAVVTCGAAQSNFIRQLGAACSKVGIECHAVVMAMPFEFEPPHELGLKTSGGNCLLNEILGVNLYFEPDGTWDDLYQRARELAEKLEKKGRKVFRIPIGGSSALAAYAFTLAADEISQQAPPFDEIVVATSSGSTQTGLTWAYRGTATKVTGIACDPEPDIVVDFIELAAQLDLLLGTCKQLSAQDFYIHFDAVGPGYGVPSLEGNQVLQEVARLEGIFLDPIYSAKAFVGLKQLAQAGRLSDRVLFWHTGGIPAIFAMP